MGNITNAFLRFGVVTKTQTLYQYDYGQVLKFTGVELPATYEVHFSNTQHGVATTMIGGSDGVTIPDMYLTTGSDVYVWLYLHTGNSDGETEYNVIVPVIPRASISDAPPTPVQQDVITQAIAALNSAVTETGQDVEAANVAAQTATGKAEQAESAAAVAQSAKDDAVAAKTAAVEAQGAAEAALSAAEDAEDAAEEYKVSASESAQTAATKADEAASSAEYAAHAIESAEQAIANANAAAGNANEKAALAAGKAELANQAASSANAAATLANDKAALANDKAALANDKAALADQKAALADQKATAANTATSAATAAAQNANNAATYIAPVEASGTAGAAHAQGSYLIYDGKLYQATANIAIGDTLATTGVGANIAQVTGGAMGEVAGLKSAIEGGMVEKSESLSATFSDHALIIGKEDHPNYGATQGAGTSTWQASGFVSCEKYKSIDITMRIVSSATDAGIVFYIDNVDANIPSNCVAGYVCNVGTAGEEIRHFDIPAGAKYFRTSYSSSATMPFSCTGYWDEQSSGALSDIEQLQSDIEGLTEDTEDLKSKVDGETIEKYESVIVNLSDEKFVYATTNQLYGTLYSVGGSIWQYSDYVSCEKYKSIEITMPKLTGSTDAGIVFYIDNVDANIPSNCVAGYTCNSGAASNTIETRTFNIPSGAKYFRTSFLKNNEFNCIGYYDEQVGGLDGLIQDVGDLSDLETEEKSSIVEAINEVNANTGNVVEFNEPIDVVLSTGMIVIANSSDGIYGKLTGIQTGMYSGFINVEKYKRIDITMCKYVNPTNAGIVFYSDNDTSNIPSNCVQGYTFNSGAPSLTTEVRTFDIPTGAKYFRTTYHTSFNNFSCVGYYDVETGGIAEIYKEVRQNAESIAVIENQSTEENIAVKVTDFDDGEKTDDQIIASALAFASSFPKKVIVFDTRDWHISNAILLEANTKVIIDGVKIKQNDGTFDNVFRGKNFVVDPENPNMFALSIIDTENISIIGLNGATIEGPDVNATIYNPGLQETVPMVGDEYGWRAFQIYLCSCDGIEISGLKITKTRNWAITFEFCKNGHVHDIWFNTNCVANGDGIDLRIGCHHFNIHDITGFTKDDTVACTALYPGYNNASYPVDDYMFPCVASRTGQSLENVDQRQLDIHDVRISNIHTGGVEHSVICLCNNGLQVYNVGIYNVDEQEESEKEAVVFVYTGYGSSWHQGSYTAGDLHNISAGTITANGADVAFKCNTTVADVYLNKLVQSVTGKSVHSISDMSGITITNTEQ